MDAHIWMGSQHIVAQNYTERLSPYDGRVVSRSAECSAEDAREALLIAQNAAKKGRKIPLHQKPAAHRQLSQTIGQIDFGALAQ